MNKKLIVLTSIYLIIDILFGLYTRDILNGITMLLFAYIFNLIICYKDFPVTSNIMIRYSKISDLKRYYLRRAFANTVLFSVYIILCHLISLICLSISFDIFQILKYFIFLNINFLVLQYAMIIDQLLNKKYIVTISLLAIGLTLWLLPEPFLLFSFIIYPLSNYVNTNFILIVTTYICIIYISNALGEVKNEI